MVEACVDAKAVAQASVGCARPPKGDAAALAWRSIILYCASAERAGVRWRGWEPLVWTPRAWNAAADQLAALTRAGPIDFCMEREALNRWGRGGCTRVRLFSDGSKAGPHVTWASLCLVEVNGLWRLAAAKSGRLPADASVPDAEWHGAAQSWQLEARVRAACVGRSTEAAAGHRKGRPLSAVEVYQLELLTNLGWAAPLVMTEGGRSHNE